MRVVELVGRRRVMRVSLVCVAFVLVAACGGSPEGPSTTPDTPAAQPTAAPMVLAAPTMLPGDPVPAPKAAPVLTLTGKIASANGEKSLRLDPALLDELGLVEVSVYEPWVKQDMQFQGVWLADLLKVAQADGSATGVHATALDDYQVDLTMADINAGGILLATRAGDGSAIPIEDGGPTRIVFTSGTRAGSSAAQWIWSLSTIDVR